MRRRNPSGLKLSFVFCVLALLLSFTLSAFLPRLVPPVSAISTTLGYNLSTEYVAIISGPDGKPIDTSQPILAYPDSSAVYIEVDKDSGQIIFAETDGGSGPGYMYDPSISPLTINIYRASDSVECNERRCQNEIKSTNPLTANGGESIIPLASYTFPNDVVKVVSSRSGSSFTFSSTTASGETTETTVDDNPSAGDSASSSSDTSCSSAASGLGWIICPVANFLSGALTSLYSWMGQFLQVNPMLFSSFTGADGGTTGLRSAWSIFRNAANVFFVIYILIMIFSQITGVGITNYGIKKNLPRVIVSAILINLSFYLCAAAVDISNVIGASIKSLFDAIASGISVAQTGIYGGITSFSTAVNYGAIGILTTGTVGYFIGRAATIGGLASAGSGLLLGITSVFITLVVGVLAMFVALAARQGLIVLCVAIAPLAMICYTLPNTKSLFDKWWKAMKGLIIMYPLCGFVIGTGNLASRILLATGSDLWTILIAAIVQVGPYVALPSLIRGSLNSISIGSLGSLGKLIGGGARNINRDANKFTQEHTPLRRLVMRHNIDKSAYERSRAQRLSNRYIGLNQERNSAVEQENRDMQFEYARETRRELESASPGSLKNSQKERLIAARKILDDEAARKASIARMSSPEYWNRVERIREDKEREQQIIGAMLDIKQNSDYNYGKNFEKMAKRAIAIYNNASATEAELVQADALARTLFNTKGGEGVMINAIYGLDASGRAPLAGADRFGEYGLKRFNMAYQRDVNMQKVLAVEDGNLNMFLTDLMANNGTVTYTEADVEHTLNYDTLVGSRTGGRADFDAIGRRYTEKTLKDATKLTAASNDTIARYRDYIPAGVIESALNSTNLGLADKKRASLETAPQYTRPAEQAAATDEIRYNNQRERYDASQTRAIVEQGRAPQPYDPDPRAYSLPEGFNINDSVTGGVVQPLNRPDSQHIFSISDTAGNRALFDSRTGRFESTRRFTVTEKATGLKHSVTGFDMPTFAPVTNAAGQTGEIDTSSITYNPGDRRLHFQFIDTSNPANRINGRYDISTGQFEL